MKKLEKNILKKVYFLETKRTFVELVFRLGSILIVLGVGLYVVVGFIKQLIKQQTLDMFQIFQEDTEIIKEYLSDVLNTVYEELPKNELIWIIALFIIFLLLVLFFIRNFGKIRNKIKALKKYWFK